MSATREHPRVDCTEAQNRTAAIRMFAVRAARMVMRQRRVTRTMEPLIADARVYPLRAGVAADMSGCAISDRAGGPRT
jgi:hypothetical protein